MSQLAQIQPAFAEQGVRVVAVTLGKPSEVTLFGARFSEHIMCLADPAQQAYRAYGIGKLNLLKEGLNPEAWRAYARARAAGHKNGMSDQDMMQMNATFLIGTDGILRAAHYNRYVGDHADWTKLLADWTPRAAQPV